MLMPNTDLDGDEFHLIGLPSLHPRSCDHPGGYAAPPRNILNQSCILRDVANFVCDYITGDIVGLIATTHLQIADRTQNPNQSQLGIRDPDCIRLAQLHSDAVDFAKTGQPVPMKNMVWYGSGPKPDWYASEMNTKLDSYYESQSALGKLYRAIELHDSAAARRKPGHPRPSPTSPGGAQQPNSAPSSPLRQRIRELVVLHVDRRHLSEDFTRTGVHRIFRAYADELQRICANNAVRYSRKAQLTEEEVFIGTIIAKTSQPRQRTNLMTSMRTQAAELVAKVQEGFESQESEESEVDGLHVQLAHSWYAWEASQDKEGLFGAASFGWIALGWIFDAIGKIEAR